MKQFTQKERSPILGDDSLMPCEGEQRRYKINKNEDGNSEKRTTAIRRTKTSKWLTRGRKIPVSCCDPTSVVRNTTACVREPHRTKG